MKGTGQLEGQQYEETTTKVTAPGAWPSSSRP